MLNQHCISIVNNTENNSNNHQYLFIGDNIFLQVWILMHALKPDYVHAPVDCFGRIPRALVDKPEYFTDW